MSKRPIQEIYKDLANCKPGKEARKLHKELKQYGDGLLFLDRYPMLPMIISTAALILSILVIATQIVP